MAKDRTIIRTRKTDNPFVMVDKYGINDETLSWKAKGILVYLLSKPDDWTVVVADLIKRAKDGRDSVRSGLKELEKAGYLVKYQHRGEDGKFGEYEYIVYERPVEPKTENPSTVGKTVNGKSVNGKSGYGKSATTNNNYTNNDVTKNDITNNNIDRLIENKEESPERKKKNVVVENKLESFLKEKKIKVNKKTITHWRSMAKDEIILNAVKCALDKPDVRNLVGYVTGMLTNGFKPHRAQESIPDYILSQGQAYHAEIGKNERIEALDLMLKLGEIDKQEYQDRMKRLSEE